MKPSPLQLKWVSYPAASHEVVEDYKSESGESDSVPVEVQVEITWEQDREHLASLSLRSREGVTAPYKFSVSIVGVFSFDLELATKTYNPTSRVKLSGIIGANIARIMFSGAREHIAMMTARGPYGPIQVESMLIEPSDVKFSSSVPPADILRDIFQVPSDELVKLEQQFAEHLKEQESGKSKELTLE